MKLTLNRMAAAALFFVAGLVAAPQSAKAQGTCPYIAYGAVMTAAQWQSCFTAKQNTLGYTPVNKAGDTMLGKLNAKASLTDGAGFNLIPGLAPTSPVNGDVWTTSTGMFTRVNGVTVGPFVDAAGTVSSIAGTANQITASASTGAVTLSLPSAVILPGTLRVNSAITYGGVTLSNSVTGTGSMVLSASPTFSGVVTLSSNNGEPLRLNGATTGPNVISLTNTGGQAYFGQENSAGGNIIVGSTAYDTVIRGPSGISFSANAGASLSARITSTGINSTNIGATTRGSGAFTTLSATTPLTVASGGTGLASGTSGGVPYFSSSSTMASSGALTANAPVLGGGAGAAPTVGTRSGNTTEFASVAAGAKTSGNVATWDASGNIQDGGPIASQTVTTFTPTLTFGGGSTGMSLTGVVGRAVKTGKQVTVQISFLVTTRGSSTGVAQIGNLPDATFTASGLFSDYFAVVTNGAVGAQFVYFGELGSGASTVDMYYRFVSTGAQAQATHADFPNGTYVSITLNYITN